MLGLAACGGGSSIAVDPPHATASGSITVTSSYHPDSSGGYYVEGALSEVLLIDSGGSLVATKQSVPGKPVTFDNMPLGSYLVKPALRSCEGSCSALDPRSDFCQAQVDVQGPVQVRVRYQIGSRCTIQTPS